MRDADFERLYAEHAQGLFGFLAYRVNDRVLAEDLVADTFERVLRSRRRFDPRKGSEKAWIYSIAMNLLRDRARRDQAETRAMERSVPVPAHGVTSPHELVDERDQLREALASLAPEEYDAIALRFGGDLTGPEIADMLDLTLANVQQILSRSLRRLRVALEEPQNAS